MRPHKVQIGVSLAKCCNVSFEAAFFHHERRRNSRALYGTDRSILLQLIREYHS
jgi:hypothetical protein